MNKKKENQYFVILKLLWKFFFEKVASTPKKINSNAVTAAMKSYFFHNYKIKLFAVTVAVMFSVYVIQQDVGEKNFTVPLSVKHSSDFALSENAPKQLDVYISGAKNELVNFDINDVYAEIDLESKKAGTFEYTPLVRGLDEQFQILRLSPQKITVSLSKLAKKRVRIEPTFTGRIKQNYSLNNYTITPSRVSISGPEDILEELAALKTEPIDIENLDANKEVEVFLSKSTHPSLILADDEKFKVELFVTTKKIEKLITGDFLINKPSLEELGLKFTADYFVKEINVSIELANKNTFIPSRDLYFYFDASAITQPGEYRLRVLSREVFGVKINNIVPKFVSVMVADNFLKPPVTLEKSNIRLPLEEEEDTSLPLQNLQEMDL